MATWTFNYAGQPLANDVSDENKVMMSKLILDGMEEGNTAWVHISNQVGSGQITFLLHPHASFSFESTK